MNKVKYIPGDLVIYKGNVCEIMSADNGDKRHSQYSIIQVGKGIESFTFAHERDIEPIPISAQILEKNGIIIDEENGYWEDGLYREDYVVKGNAEEDALYLYPTFVGKKNKTFDRVTVYANRYLEDHDGWSELEMIHNGYLCTCFYVHTLQHLLFGLGLKSEMEV